VGVWKTGKVVSARSFSVLTEGERQLVTAESVFHTASINKTFVAICVLELVEQGKVKLDDSVTRLTPSSTRS
jgi:CubicO group peptidase (beta-lactamase class C family)